MTLVSTDSDLQSDESASVRIFVYGSLKRGYDLHHLLESQASLGQAVTKPFYRIFDLGSYPGMIEWPEGLAVQGEVYRVDPDCLKHLDDVEGVEDGCYARREVSLQAPFEGQVVHAWFWLNPVAGFRDCGVSWPVSASEDDR